MKLKRIKIGVSLVLLPFLVPAQGKITRLTGTMPAYMNGQKASVMYGGFRKMRLDSTTIKNGKLYFELPGVDSQVVHLSIGETVPVDNLAIYIADADVAFSTKDSLKNAVVTGHKLSEDYNRMNAAIVKLMNARFAYMRQLSTLSTEQQKGEAGLELKAKMNELAKAEKAATYRAIDNNGSSYIALMLLKTAAGGTLSYDEIMPHFQKLSKELQASAEGKALEEKIMLVKNLRSGVEANDFESITPDGKKLKLSDVISKSKYTFVDFWASWCMPCRAENPNVVKAYQQFGNKGLTILSVSLDTKAEPWKAAIQKDGMPWLHVSQLRGFDEPAATIYGIKMIPQNVLINSKGKIVATNLRGYALEEKLKELLN